MKNTYRNIKFALLRLFGLSLMILCVVVTNACAQKNSNASTSVEPPADYEWFKVAENIYQFRYQHHYTLFVTTSKGIIAFDPLSNEAAEHYASAIREVAPGKPLLAIIYTHWHVDHSSGAKILLREFGNEIPVIAHQRTMSRLQRWNDPEIVLPTQTISDKGDILRYGGQLIELKYIGFGHTDTMLVARFPKQKLVFVVDFANNDAVGWTDLPGWYIGELINMQGRLLEMDFEKVAFAHGLPGDKKTIKRQISYYKELTRNAKRALNKDLTEDEAVALIEPVMQHYQHWHYYDDWFLLNIRGAYRWAKSSN